MVTVFVAAFLAGGTAAVGVNRFIDVTRTRAKATVECEPIFVAIRDLPSGNPVTVWDVRLREWPKAMVPQAALRPGSFEGIAWPEGHVARLSLREGQPVLRSHLRATVVDMPPAAPQAVVVAEPVAITAEPVAITKPELVVEPAADVVAQAAAVPEPPVTDEAPTVIEAPTVTDSAPVDDATAVADVAADAETTVAADQTPTESVTGEGWPSTAESVAGSEAAMRFLVVPERIAIMADELTTPRKPQPPSTPVATVATQPKQPAASTKPAPSGKPASSATPGPTAKPVAKQTVTKQPIPRAKYPDQSPSSKPRPKGVTLAPTPRVTVEPDAESQLADDAARTPTLKSVFPNMAAGLEKIESEMTRFRRDRLGSLFRPTGEPEGEPAEGEGNEPSGQWLPSLRYR
jgi:hypothetical protein